MRRLPPLKALLAFEAVARRGSLTAAAAELFVTHSAVSQQLRQLEDHLGQLLFARTGRVMKLTPAGQLLAEDVRHCLDRLAAVTGRLAGRSGRRILHVNATPSLAARWVLPRMEGFAERWPHIDVRVVTSVSDGADLLDRGYDLVIRREPMERPGHACVRMAEDRATVALTPGLLARVPLADAADLLGMDLLHLRSRADAWQRWFDLAGIEVPSALPGHHYDHFFLSIQAALSGIGAVLAPRVLLEEELSRGRLVLPFPELELVGPGFFGSVPDHSSTDADLRAVLDWLVR